MSLHFPGHPCPQSNAVLVLEDRCIFWGQAIGFSGKKIGEMCFNTSMTGYQEIITDPSYGGQIICFTFPHIGNVGANDEDVESSQPLAQGCVLKNYPTVGSNFRLQTQFNQWLKKNHITGICGIDTRHLTHHIRKKGPLAGVICHGKYGKIDIDELVQEAKNWSQISHQDLIEPILAPQATSWDRPLWQLNSSPQTHQKKYHVVALDYGIKHNILRHLTQRDCRITVLASSATAQDVLAHNPDGIFLSNGPGDPQSISDEMISTIKTLIDTAKPLFGICFGHQVLCRALGAKTYKMDVGHRGANHPVKNEQDQSVEITSQNHGFAVDEKSLPDHVIPTHRSLFDQTLSGIRVKNQPIFSVQYHPEASPGPQDSTYLFDQFIDFINKEIQKPK